MVKGRCPFPLTSCYDVIKAGRFLLADPIGGRAQERAVVQLRHRLVRDNGGGAVTRYVTGGHIDTLRRIVERPLELDVGRIRVHHALDLGRLVFGDPVHSRLIRGTCWRICNHQTNTQK